MIVVKHSEYREKKCTRPLARWSSIRIQADMTCQLVLGDIVPVECFAKMTLPIEDNAGNRNQYKMQIRLVSSRPANVISPGSHAA